MAIHFLLCMWLISLKKGKGELVLELLSKIMRVHVGRKTMGIMTYGCKETSIARLIASCMNNKWNTGASREDLMGIMTWGFKDFISDTIFLHIWSTLGGMKIDQSLAIAYLIITSLIHVNQRMIQHRGPCRNARCSNPACVSIWTKSECNVNFTILKPCFLHIRQSWPTGKLTVKLRPIKSKVNLPLKISELSQFQNSVFNGCHSLLQRLK